MASTTFLDLPVEILIQVIAYLDVPSFTALTATCKALHRPQYTADPLYWSALVRRDFRVPNQPVVQNDGWRWRALYRRMKTQSRVYTWGNNDNQCLGHKIDEATTPPALFRTRGGGFAMRRRIPTRPISKWPGEVEDLEQLGIISDMACGGWSTTLLTSKGELYSIGVLDGELVGMRNPATTPSGMQRPHPSPARLRFPGESSQTDRRRDATTTVKQFSSGRAHVLGLTDSGQIHSWSSINHPGHRVKFLHTEVRGVKKVVAGWDKSTALVENVGIVVWQPLQSGEDEEHTVDTALVTQSTVVPNTKFKSSDMKYQSTQPDTVDPDSAEHVGEVLNWIVLEKFILFNTSLGKVFAALISWNDDEQHINPPVQVALPGDETFATDVQGSFRSFAVFTRSGAVLTSDTSRIMDLFLPMTTEQTLREPFRQIPALQNKGVISVAFGDYHFHALHAAGFITSYGKEPRSCGALGLGGAGPEGRLRGVRNGGMGEDGVLVPHAYTSGRQIWFEPEKKEWIVRLTSGGVDPQEAAERIRLAIGSPGTTVQGEVSEWIEQQGMEWEQKYNVQRDEDDGLPAYFALSVSAAGWHSGALVLVNESLADKVREAIEVPAEPEKPEHHQDKTEGGSSPASAEQPPPDPSSTVGGPQPASDWGSFILSAFGTAPLLSQLAQSLQTYLASWLNLAQGEPAGAREDETPTHAPHPSEFGASPREGVDYIWARDHFPRLVLSDGTEMPGEVEFDTWRFGRPAWRLEDWA